jgi:transcription-repair coupling factor (superfamily II helicase)
MSQPWPILHDRHRADPAWRQILDHLARPDNRPVQIIGPSDSHKNWLIWFACQEQGRKICLLVADELRARSVAADFAALTDQPILTFRSRELNFTAAEAVSHESEWQRMAILDRMLAGHYGAVVVTAAAAIQKLPPVALYRHHRIQLRVGQRLDLDALCSRLLQNGYERTRTTDSQGQFARRGDIVDIMPPLAEDGQPEEGVRLSFFDDELDAIKRFDPESQRSSVMLQEIALPPAREWLFDLGRREELAESILAAGQAGFRQLIEGGVNREQADTVRQLARHDAERLAAGAHLSALDRWLPLLYPDAASVLDYAQSAGALLCLDEPLRVRNRLDAAQADLDERVRTLLLKGQVLPLAAQAGFRGVDIQARIESTQPVMSLSQIASSGNSLPGAAAIHLAGRPSDSYRGREEQLTADLKSWTHKADLPGVAILFAGSEARKQRIGQKLQAEGLDVTVLATGLMRGFTWPAAGLMVIGTQDIFGSDRPARRRGRQGGLHIDLFSDLVPGELVVHEAHGIGRYEGLVTLDSKGSRRDYLKIVYTGDDALYIPMESLDQIQKYVGTDGREPRLSKLGGQEWTRMKERARDSIRKLATDLIRLYAERSARQGRQFAPDTVWQQEFEENFPFEETQDQIRSIAEIKRDMEQTRVMDRLLCGDVGFGKTEVAFRAIFKCVMDGCQAVMLAPTTVLAQQHFDNLRRRMQGFPIQIGLLSRFASEAMQKQTLSGLAHGKVDVVVGTHRLLSQDVRLKNLGLLIIDEEQRFGVDHKEKLKAIWPTVDVLTLTATPIPRTLHMAMSGIRDISVLEEPPLDRRPVQTYVMEYDQAVVQEAILREVTRRGQVFYLFNDTRRIAEKAAELELALPGARVLSAHGKMSEKILEEVISVFINQEADILVCTTIIESGIDMPNVNTIIVEDADRLGLAQLYQLRGRVGRSDRQAYAYVTYRRDKVLTEVAEKRLSAIRDFTELGAGFKIALRDLEVRGAGNLLGAEQHGQLEAIGYDLYCRMLDEAVRELQGQPAQQKISATIELDLDAFIPRSAIADEGLRMDVYRRVAAIATLADYQDVLDEWLDRFGAMPAPAMALTDIAYSRSAAERFGFARVYQQQQNLVLTYAEGLAPDMGRLAKLLNLPEYKGKLLFNAGTKPYLVYLQAAADRRSTAARLRQLMVSLEQESARHCKVLPDRI